MITIATQCDDRKAMVRRLSERLQTPAVYLYTPTYAFRIGEITVNRDASVSGEREALLPTAECLLENGYITELPAELTAADPEATAEEVPAEAEPADSAAEDITVTTLRIYEPDWTVQSMTNLMHMLYARQDLINRMLQMNCLRIDEAYRAEAYETCPGLTELWTEPFTARYDSKDSPVMLRFRMTDSGDVQVAANILEAK